MNEFKDILKFEIIKELLFQTRNGSIKSFHADDKVYDITNTRTLQPEDLINCKLLLSNKFIPLMCDNFDLKEVTSVLCPEQRDIQLITEDLRFMNLNVTFHAVHQLLKRFVYIYMNNQNKFEFGIQMNQLYTKYFDYCINLILTNDLDLIKKDETVIKLISLLLRLSKPFSKSNAGRHKDVWNFELRERIHENDQKYFIHPFLFIVEDGFIKTVELYSSSLSMHNANKFTSDNKRFIGYLHKVFGV